MKQWQEIEGGWAVQWIGDSAETSAPTKVPAKLGTASFPSVGGSAGETSRSARWFATVPMDKSYADGKLFLRLAGANGPMRVFAAGKQVGDVLPPWVPSFVDLGAFAEAGKPLVLCPRGFRSCLRFQLGRRRRRSADSGTGALRGSSGSVHFGGCAPRDHHPRRPPAPNGRAPRCMSMPPRVHICLWPFASSRRMRKRANSSVTSSFPTTRESSNSNSRFRSPSRGRPSIPPCTASK